MSNTLNAIHVVRNGESLASIAAQYFGDVNKHDVISAANKLSASTPITVGQRLAIPGLGALPLPAIITALPPILSTTPHAEVGPEEVVVTASVWWKNWKYWAGIAVAVSALYYFTQRKS